MNEENKIVTEASVDQGDVKGGKHEKNSIICIVFYDIFRM